MRRFCMLLVVAVTALPLLGSPVGAAPGGKVVGSRAGADVTRLCVSTSSQRVRLPVGGSCASDERTLVLRPSRRRGLCLRAQDVRRVGAGECKGLGGVFRRVPSRTTLTLCARTGRWLTTAPRRSRCGGDATWLIRNHAPGELTLRANVLTGDVAAGSIMGALTVDDVDRGDHTTFSLVRGQGDQDNARFFLDGAVLRNTQTIPAGSYAIRVRARDLLGASTEVAFTITVGPQEKIA